VASGTWKNERRIGNLLLETEILDTSKPGKREGWEWAWASLIACLDLET